MTTISPFSYYPFVNLTLTFNTRLQDALNGALRVFSWVFVAAFGLSSFLNVAVAQEPVKSPPASSATPTPTPMPKVTKVTGLIALHKTLEVDCEGLKEWAQTKTNDPSKLVLYLDGTQMKGLAPKIDKANANQLFFKLERFSGNDASAADNTKAWAALLSRPGLEKNVPVRVTVGPETGLPFESDQKAFLYAINTSWFGWYIVGLILLLVGMVVLAYKSDLLRDSSSRPTQPAQPDGGPNSAPKPARKPYSLARTQMAFWFFLIVAAYGFIFLVTGATDTITASVLGLMGISAGTGLAAVAVDNSKRAQAQVELDKLKAEQAKLQRDQIAAATGIVPPESLQRLNALPGLIATQQASLDQLKAEQTKLRTQQKAETEATPFPAESLSRLNALPDSIAAQQATLDQLKGEQARLQRQLEEAAAAGFPGESLQRLTDLPRLIAAQQAIVDPGVGKWFIYDILSDANAISFHRLQIAVWTLVLGIIFVDSVYNVLSMPTFSATLLGLMGISGGTYIGFKIPENLG